jgi:hypothetical protein
MSLDKSATAETAKEQKNYDNPNKPAAAKPFGIKTCTISSHKITPPGKELIYLMLGLLLRNYGICTLFEREGDSLKTKGFRTGTV